MSEAKIQRCPIAGLPCMKGDCALWVGKAEKCAIVLIAIRTYRYGSYE